MRPVWLPQATILLALAGLHIGTASLPAIYDELPGQYAGTAWEMVESGQ